MRILLIIILTAAIGVIFFYNENTRNQNKPAVVITKPSIKNPSAKNDVKIGGEFNLVNSDNNPITNKDFIGKHVLVFFGLADGFFESTTTVAKNGKDNLKQFLRR